MFLLPRPQCRTSSECLPKKVVDPVKKLLEGRDDRHDPAVTFRNPVTINSISTNSFKNLPPSVNVPLLPNSNHFQFSNKNSEEYIVAHGPSPKPKNTNEILSLGIHATTSNNLSEPLVTVK